MPMGRSVLAWLLVVATAHASSTPQNPAQNLSLLIGEALDTMSFASNAVFSTLSSNGRDINSRLMSPKPPANFTGPTALSSILIDTNIFSRKVKECTVPGARVNLIYYDAEGDGYVSFRGSVSLTSWEEAKREYWDGWNPFYPNGSDTPNYGLLKIVPDEMELVSSVRFKVSSGRTDWLPVTLTRESSGWRVKVPAVPPPPPGPGSEWVCTVCEHVYDPLKDGAGVPFEDLPEDWKCPVCGKPKKFYVKQARSDGSVQWVH